MPSVKIPRKSTDTDMTPFVDIAFLILSFFMLATKFKPPELVPITTPGSVLSQKLPDNNAVMVTVDSASKVYFTVLSESDPGVFDQIIQGINNKMSLGLTKEQMANFKKTYMVGVPFSGLKSLLSVAQEDQKNIKQPGIPVMDSATNELVWWISESKSCICRQAAEIPDQR